MSGAALPVSRRCNRRASSVQENPKEIQGKKLAFPWIPLVESGLFNALQRKKEKNALRSDSPIELCKTAAALPFRINDPIGSDPVSRNTHSTHLDFENNFHVQKIVAKPGGTARRRAMNPDPAEADKPHRPSCRLRNPVKVTLILTPPSPTAVPGRFGSTRPYLPFCSPDGVIQLNFRSAFRL